MSTPPGRFSSMIWSNVGTLLCRAAATTAVNASATASESVRMTDSSKA
jgi:hypothetical protein